MIHIFNPEHDIALGAHLKQFTAPHAARQLRHDLGFLPMIWAEDGDKVLVEDVAAAEEAFRHLGLEAKGSFLSWENLADALDMRCPEEIAPWGWDLALYHRMVMAGASPAILPLLSRLERIRQLSHRRWAAEHLLPFMRRIPDTVGEAKAVSRVGDVLALLKEHPLMVVKAPWSCSGRGIRYIDSRNQALFGVQIRNWMRNIISRQGCLMVEPYYNKVADFAMEFFSDGRGEVHYRGLSVFDTRSGAYTGSILDTEQGKEDRLASWVNHYQLNMINEQLACILCKELGNQYRGPLGVDMMVVRVGDKLKVHPCVELNLRGTMGHVALALTRRLKVTPQIMSVVYTDKYRIRVSPVPSAQDDR